MKMDELDILKKHWNETRNFPKISKEELRTMIHKKSTSLVMWILIISVIEFILLNVISMLFPIGTSQNETVLAQTFIDKLDYVSMTISLIFIFIFYKNYRKIRIYSSSKDLMNQIIKTKKTVNYYIYTNILLVIFGVFYSMFFMYHYIDRSTTLLLIILFIAVTLFITLIIWLFYKVVYGFLLRKLTNNLKELERINEESN